MRAAARRRATARALSAPGAHEHVRPHSSGIRRRETTDRLECCCGACRFAQAIPATRIAPTGAPCPLRGQRGRCKRHAPVEIAISATRSNLGRRARTASRIDVVRRRADSHARLQATPSPQRVAPSERSSAAAAGRRGRARPPSGEVHSGGGDECRAQASSSPRRATGAGRQGGDRRHSSCRKSKPGSSGPSERTVSAPQTRSGSLIRGQRRQVLPRRRDFSTGALRAQSLSKPPNAVTRVTFAVHPPPTTCRRPPASAATPTRASAEAPAIERASYDGFHATLRSRRPARAPCHGDPMQILLCEARDALLERPRPRDTLRGTGRRSLPINSQHEGPASRRHTG